MFGVMPMAHNPSGHVAPGMVKVYENQRNAGTNTNNFLWENVPIGKPSRNRRLVIVSTGLRNESSSNTRRMGYARVDGQATTNHQNPSGSGGRSSAANICSINWPEGETADIITSAIDFDSNFMYTAIVVYAIYSNEPVVYLRGNSQMASSVELTANIITRPPNTYLVAGVAKYSTTNPQWQAPMERDYVDTTTTSRLSDFASDSDPESVNTGVSHSAGIVAAGGTIVSALFQ